MLAKLLTRLGRTADAIGPGRDACELLEKGLLATPSDWDIRFELGRSLLMLGSALEYERQATEALQCYQRSEAVLAPMFRERSSDHETAVCYAASLIHLGQHALAVHDYTVAAKIFDQSNKIQSKLMADYPAILDYRWDVAESEWCLGRALAGLARDDEAQGAFERARALQQELVAAAPDNPDYRIDLGATESRSAALLARRGELEEAFDLARSAIEHTTKCVQASSEEPVYLRYMVDAQLVLAAVDRELGRHDEELQALDEAVRIGLAKHFAERDLSVRVLDGLVKQGDETREQVLAADDFAALRERPEFEAWVAAR